MKEYKDVKSYISNCHKRSLRVVFTHGVFDLLHKGHLKTINDSLNFGDVLIVGIDSDSLVKKLKGKDRPIIGELDRLEVIKNLKAVSYAFILNPNTRELNNLEDYFLRLYKYLQLDSITSGNPSEYRIEQREICSEAGIEYHLAGAEVVETTTSIIKRVLDK